MTSVQATTTPVRDREMVARLWPVLLASALGLVPFTVLGTYLVTIAGDGGWAVSALGSLRGLGGVAALVTGLALAPLLDRVPRLRVAALALVVLAVAALLGTLPALVAVAGFCLLVGGATSMLNPALAAAAAAAYDDDARAGRAATLVTATQSMTAMLAAPVVALPALVWGWRSPLVLVAVAALGCALLLRRREDVVPESTERPSYLAALREVLTRPRSALLLAVSLLRTTAFMGWLAYVAALYDGRFGLAPEVFALVWTLSGAAFFLGNLLTGRWLGRLEWLRPVGVTAFAGNLVACVALALLVLAPTLPVALLGTTLLAGSHAVVAACVTTLLVRTADGAPGATLALNGVAQSLGVFLGAACGGAGLALAGWPGLGLALGATTALAAALAAILLPRLDPTERTTR